MLKGNDIHWLVDLGLPQVESTSPDILPINKHRQDILTEALKSDRWVVTTNLNFLEHRTIPFECPPIVIVEGGTCTDQGLKRNLLHFEFCLLHDQKYQSWKGQRFLIDLDRAIYRLLPEGGIEELEVWKTPSIKAVLAWGASA